MNKPFTIITVSFNQAQYLEQCITSILDQNEPVEYIIMDGGSTDGSIEIIRKYEDRISYWISEKDNGPANALNKGITRATGEFVGYINSDDYLLPGALKTLRKVMEANPGYDVYYGSGIVNNESQHTTTYVHPTLWHVGVYRAGLSVMFQQANFIRRSFLGDTIRFNERNTTHWDGELLVDLALAKAKFFRFKDVISAFRIHGLSISGGAQGASGYSRYEEQRIWVSQKIDSHYPDLQKSKTYWMIWLFINDTITMIKRGLDKAITRKVHNETTQKAV